ncbi:translesion DNA synthesis-associated protein ImuA [Ectothiorhodospira haloalkaliphila]|uniref:translesion DNA synthesis-associated protein ImuA n=1 Tax=Ectothiorhodospira haloalkaliphila TaxID=421628 RepID=UPI001EE7BCD2|nr:translesion DNA synthesis-associated protein ImuA [Ectothiorhodospira haloalkaliphila]MCG5525207.1 translesion DNA synthesis-associated protein ImuA [Ectothiorhodospira haloalkaliphila]
MPDPQAPSDATPTLESLLQRPDIWRGGGQDGHHRQTLSSGDAALDQRLGGGWPQGALVELLLDQHGIGEVSLLLPALAALTQGGRAVALVAPPYVPYAPALRQAGIHLRHLLWITPRDDTEILWAMEQILRAGPVGAALVWPQRLTSRQLRRLQLAAEQGRATGFIYRPTQHIREPSPAALRLRLHADREGSPRLEIIKQRGPKTTPQPLPEQHQDIPPGARDRTRE